MTHHRSVIRQSVVDVLIAAATLAGSNVVRNPRNPRTRFPALSVVDGDERQSARSLHAGPTRAIERRYSFDVRCEVQQLADQDTTADTLAAQVEAAMANAAIAGVKAITPTGAAFMDAKSGELAITVVEQGFEALYYTPQGDPSTPE